MQGIKKICIKKPKFKDIKLILFLIKVDKFIKPSKKWKKKIKIKE